MPKPSTLSDAKRAAICERYLRGESMRAIALVEDTSTGAVHHALTRAGIARRPPGRKPAAHPDDNRLIEPEWDAT